MRFDFTEFSRAKEEYEDGESFFVVLGTDIPVDFFFMELSMGNSIDRIAEVYGEDRDDLRLFLQTLAVRLGQGEEVIYE